MITPEIIQAATAYAREPNTTFQNLRRYIEFSMENAHHAAIAERRGGMALDAAPFRSFFMNDEAIAAADDIWELFQEPSPSSFFEGVPHSEGMAAYQAHMENGRTYKPASKGAYI